MNLVSHQAEFFSDVCKLREYAVSLGFVITLGEAMRTIEQQTIYVKTGRSKTMKSNHLRRLAVDLNFFRDGKYICTEEELRPLGIYWESLSPFNRWGGNFDGDFKKKDSFIDAPHFERNVV